MAQSARIRRRHGRSSSRERKDSKERSSQSNRPSRTTNKLKKKYEEEETMAEAAGELEELFIVEKIVDSKLDKNGAPLYKTRWHGYTAADDTWEPTENVASTGHVDRYERKQRQKALKKSSAGVAVIEYEDGEREMVNMKLEKFRGYRPDSVDDERDDDTVDGDDDVNDFMLVEERQWIEILWRHTNMYFPCKIISWTPLRPKKSHKKGTGNSHLNTNINNIHLSRRIQHAVTGFVLLSISYMIPPYPVGFILLITATAAFYHVHRKRVRDDVFDDWYLERFGALLREHERGEWEESNDAGASDAPKEQPPKPKLRGDPAARNRRRRKTKPALPGAFYFLLGTSLSTFLFPTSAARASLLVLSIADPVAGLVGAWCSGMGWNVSWKQLLQRTRANGREYNGGAGGGGPSIAGSVACAGSTILCTAVYIPSNVLNAESSTSTGSLSLCYNSRLCVGILTALTEAIAGRNLPMIGTMPDDNLLIPLVVGSLICWLSD